MSNFFECIWPISEDGYEVKVIPPTGGTTLLTNSPERRVISPRSSACRNYDPMQSPLNGGEPLLFRTLADLDKTEQGVIAFANRFGLLTPGEENDLDDWFARIEGLQLQINRFEAGVYRSEDWTEASCGLGGGIGGRIQMVLRKEGTNDGMAFKLKLPSLRAALWTQFGLWVSKPGMYQRKCGFCGHWFTYGHGTGRRKSAKYCRRSCINSANHHNRKHARTAPC